MARKKTPPSPPAAPAENVEHRGWVRRVIFRPPFLLATALITGGVMLAPSIDAWLPDLGEQPEYRFETAELRINAPHRWVPRDLVTRVIADADLADEVSLLDETLSARIAQAFSRNPWIAKVVHVRVSRHHGVEAQLEYRWPVAMVATRSGVYPVDRGGVLLPPGDFRPEDIGRFPALRGIGSPPMGPAGSTWGDPLVLAGAKLAEALTPDGDLVRYWQTFGLQAIEPATADPELDAASFELVTTGGSRIVWGRPPGADELEPSVAQKLGRLESYIASHGSLDPPGGRKRIDIRHFDSIEVTSLEDERGRVR